MLDHPGPVHLFARPCFGTRPSGKRRLHHTRNVWRAALAFLVRTPPTLRALELDGMAVVYRCWLLRSAEQIMAAHGTAVRCM